jgi:tRNA G18 (ribose-2'-O)-methylase SpoU
VISVRCPHCSHSWQEPDRLRGTNRKCPQCSQIVTVVEEEFYNRASEERGRLIKGERVVAPIACVILDVRSAYNVGSIFRTADGAGVAEIVVVGITPDPTNPQVVKTSLGAEESVPWRRAENLKSAVEYLGGKGYVVLAAEDSPKAKDALSEMPPPPVAFVLGNEVSGLSESDIALCGGVVKIPMLGAKASLNVGVAAGVLFYEALRLWRESSHLDKERGSA